MRRTVTMISPVEDKTNDITRNNNHNKKKRSTTKDLIANSIFIILRDGQRNHATMFKRSINLIQRMRMSDKSIGSIKFPFIIMVCDLFRKISKRFSNTGKISRG